VQPTLTRTKKVILAAGWKELLKTISLHLAALSFVAGAITLLTYIGLIPSIVMDEQINVGDGACRPDGTFDPPMLNSYDNWSPSGFFQITVGFGQLPFTAVKIIDVVWDVVVGRGGQAILAATSYIIFSKCLLRIMERNSVSYGTFEVLGFQTASASTIIKLTRDFLTNHGLRAKIARARNYFEFDLRRRVPDTRQCND
jgi:hypothetical protein